MVTFRLVQPAGDRVVSGGQDLLAQWREDASTFLWIDIAGPLHGDADTMLRRELALNPFALQDAARNRHPPKIEEFENCTFIIYKGLSADSDDIDCRTIQIALFVGERFLVSRHSDVSPSLERVAEELEAAPASFADGPGALALRFSRLMVNRYLRVLLGFEPRLEELEEALLAGEGESVLTELVRHKSALVRLQRTFHYQGGVTGQLRREGLLGFRPGQIHAINDLHEQQDRATSLVTLFYQLASDLIEGHISVSSHRLNQIMRVLTIITAIFVPLSFLAGIYGMNFQFMPELAWRPAYFVLLGVMVTVATTLLLLFRHRRWL